MDAGVGGGEEAGGPEGGAAGEPAAGGHDDVGGEVVAFGAEAVEGPGTEGGAAGLGEAGIEEELGGGVVELIGGAGADDAELVGNGSKRGEGGAEGGAGFAVLLELELRSHDGGIGLDEGVTLISDDGFREGFAFVFGEFGLRVEEFELGRGAGHEEVDDGLGFGFVLGGGRGEGACGEVVGEEGGGGNFAEANAAFAEEVAS